MNVYIKKIRPVGVFMDEYGNWWRGELIQDKDKWYDEDEEKNLEKLYEKKLEDRRLDYHYVNAKMKFNEKYIKIDLHDLLLLDRLSGVEK
jgi:hypothetical protein